MNIKTFKLSDLIGRNLSIRKLSDANLVLIVAIDVDTGEIFVLEQTYAGINLT